MPKSSRKSRNPPILPIPSVEPLTTARFAVPRLSDPTTIVLVDIEDEGFVEAQDGAGVYVTRFRFLEKRIRNEFDPKDVPVGFLREARDITNAALLEQFDLDLRHADRMAS